MTSSKWRLSSKFHVFNYDVIFFAFNRDYLAYYCLIFTGISICCSWGNSLQKSVHVFSFSQRLHGLNLRSKVPCQFFSFYVYCQIQKMVISPKLDHESSWKSEQTSHLGLSSCTHKTRTQALKKKNGFFFFLNIYINFHIATLPIAGANLTLQGARDLGIDSYDRRWNSAQKGFLAQSSKRSSLGWKWLSKTKVWYAV